MSYNPQTGPTFSVIVPTLGRTKKLDGTIRSVLATVPRPHEVLIVDGDPLGGARESVDRLADDDVIYMDGPKGLTRQRNLGLARARGDIVVFLDDDVSIPRDTFAVLSPVFEDGSVVGATGRVVEPREGTIGGRDSIVRRLLHLRQRPGTFTPFGFPRRLSSDAPEQDVEFMQGCFMCARRDVASAVRFDERLSGYGLAEDEDFSCRLSRHGRIRYLPHIVVLHDNTGFLTRDQREFGRQLVVNRTYLFRKNFPQTLGARARFRLFLLVLFAHRMINRRWGEARGMLTGTRAAGRASWNR